MSFKHGKNASMFVHAYDYASVLNSIDLNAETDVVDTTVFQSTWKTAIAGTPGGTIDFGGFFDTATDLWALWAAQLPYVVTVAPAGAVAIGDGARSASVNYASHATSVPIGGVVAFKASFGVEGKLGFGYILHPSGVDTDTTTGADRDDAASTSTGWTAHLHVSAVSAGSWVVKLQDAATNDWADVSPAIEFAAVIAAGSQHIVSATATATVRRHVRYVATRTGGTGASTITFMLAFARN